MSHDRKTKRKLIEEIHGSIDLGFSDYYEDQNVRDRTLDAHVVELRRAVELLMLEEAINYSLFQSFGSSHPSAEVYILDFPSDLRAALIFCSAGIIGPPFSRCATGSKCGFWAYISDVSRPIHKDTSIGN